MIRYRVVKHTEKNETVVVPVDVSYKHPTVYIHILEEMEMDEEDVSKELEDISRRLKNLKDKILAESLIQDDDPKAKTKKNRLLSQADELMDMMMGTE